MTKPIIASQYPACWPLPWCSGTVTIVPTRTLAGSLSTSVIGMFPKSVGEFAYADLKAARKFPWFSAALRPGLPPKFPPVRAVSGSSAVDPNSQVDEIAWAIIQQRRTDDL